MPKVTTGDWSLSGVEITVEQDSEDYLLVRMGKLDVLDSLQTILHYGGTTAYQRDITFVSFSGYEENILPLVGSGYHELISDFGSQGNYFITELSPKRVQDLVCYAGTPQVYRASAHLVKEIATVNQALVATKTNGLYYCSDITFGDNTVPVWSLNNGTYGIQSMSVDVNNPLAVQVILADDGNCYAKGTSVSADWTSILTEAEAVTLAQGFHASINNAEIFDIAYNSWYDNRVHVVFRANQGINLGGLYAATADNYGQGTWTASELRYYQFSDFTESTGGSIVVSPVATGTYAQGYTVWCSAEFQSGNSHSVSTDGGDTFNAGVNTGTGSYVGRIVASEHQQDEIWTAGSNTYLGYCRNYTPATYAQVGTERTAPLVNPDTSGLWQDPAVENNLAVAYNVLKISVNGGSSFTSKTLPGDSDLAKIAGISWDKILVGLSLNATVDDSYIMLWSTPDQGNTYYSKAGVDPQNNAAGTSLPYNNGGISDMVCWSA